LGFSRSLPGLRPSPAGPPRISRDSRRPPTGAGVRKPSWTCLPFKALENGGVRLAPPPSSRGIRRSRALPPTCLSRVHSREPEPPSVGRVPTRPILFRPRGSSPPRRFPPRGGRGSIAPRSRTRVRRVSRSPAPDVGPSEDGPGRDAPSGAPRDAVHTLRSLPSADSRTASLRPLPPCRCRPAGAGRRFSLGEAPIRRSGPPRHRSANQCGVGPPRAHHDRRSGRDAGSSNRREQLGFEALLRRQSPLSSCRRCRRPTLVPSMGFLPLRGPSCIRSAAASHEAMSPAAPR
jgi:hypothetical protein